MPTVVAPSSAPAHLERDAILKQILDHIGDFADRFDKIDYDALKKDVLVPVLEGHFDPEVQIRGFLKTFHHTVAFQKALSTIDDGQIRAQVENFVAGKSIKDVTDGGEFNLSALPSGPVKHHFSLLDTLKKIVLTGLDLRQEVHKLFQGEFFHRHLSNLPIVYEDGSETKVMEVYSNVPFENWGLSVQNTPDFTFLPTTVLGLENVVKYAKQKNYRVRCAGYRHSWSPAFSQENQILVSFVNLDTATTLPDPMSIIILTTDYGGQNVPELKTIELKEPRPDGKRLCRIGAAVTNEEFRRWSVAHNSYALPVNVIMVETTFGGVNAPVCHGAGLGHKTISDYVRRIEYVDCNGKLQMVDDSNQIRAAAGSFGLLGIITHITFELDSIQYAILEPRKVDVGLAIPPLDKDEVPEALRGPWYSAPDVDQQLAAATAEFEGRALNDYYSEWFWFPYQQKAWVNTWNPTADPTGVVSYPDDAKVFLQWVEGWIGGVMTSSPLFNAIPGYWQAQLLATMGMASLPPTKGEEEKPRYKTSMMNALHFRRGIQNMRVRDVEFQIGLPPSAEDPTKPDMRLVQRAWWDIIKLVYRDDPSSSSPMRLALELRIMGGSDVILAPQYGNLGTASIEVLTVPDTVTDGEWKRFLQDVADIWMGYGVEVRPHWAKEWDGLRFHGRDARDYLRNVACKSQFEEFRTVVEEIGREQGWTWDEMKARFSNQLLDELFSPPGETL
ncbi:hypothetical protein L249_2455 [Ophiocordyceps polyrhachis-furcata BCC 54312]|uniref:FAD-binding PCMH-type domain-containing protein n=1 Tax=Ophiocordyceps polyrhachis-furcata BCC 54312 TaxID=1330021 RepID=A0A367LPP2_9HYPO|nr:hypothetical protein L249_2455 [Ophiocordyceps polyrhachis-furcata BCC 54312]